MTEKVQNANHMICRDHTGSGVASHQIDSAVRGENHYIADQKACKLFLIPLGNILMGACHMEKHCQENDNTQQIDFKILCHYQFHLVFSHLSPYGKRFPFVFFVIA